MHQNTLFTLFLALLMLILLETASGKLSGRYSQMSAKILIILAFALAAWLLLRREERPAAVPARAVAGALVLAAAAAVLAANLLPSCPAFLSALHFDERWGANRGYAWQKLWVIYTQDLSLPQMLFGLGGDAVSARLSPDVESVRYMILLNGETFDSAHNEFLQHLVCGGALGLVCWCGFLFTAICRGIRNQPAVAAALVGYGVQSFFSISISNAPALMPLWPETKATIRSCRRWK